MQQNKDDGGMYAVLNAEHVCIWLTQVMASDHSKAATLGDLAAGELSEFHCKAGPRFTPAPTTPGDAKAFRALALACLTRLWLDGKRISPTDERWNVHNTALAVLPECLRDTNLRSASLAAVGVAIHCMHCSASTSGLCQMQMQTNRNRPRVACRDVLHDKTLQEIKNLDKMVEVWVSGLQCRRAGRTRRSFP